MIQELTQKVLSEVSMPGAVAQLIHSRWPRHSRAQYCGPHVILWMRLWPKTIKRLSWQEDSQPLVPGQLYILPADTRGGAIASENDEEDRSISLRVDSGWIRETTGCDINWGSIGAQARIDFQNLHVAQTLRRIGSEVDEPKPCSETLIESLARSIVVDLYRQFTARTAIVPSGSGYSSDAKIKRIKQFIWSHADGCPALDEIARHFDFSVSYLRALFKRETGQTVFRFIEEVRIERARSALENPNLPLKIIAHQLGFCDASAFIAAFKRVTGETPKEYRLRCMA